MAYIRVDAASDTLDKLVRSVKVEGLSRGELLTEIQRLNPVARDTLDAGSVIAVPDAAAPARRADAAPAHVVSAASAGLDLARFDAQVVAQAVRSRRYLDHVLPRLRKLVDEGAVEWKPETVGPLLDAVTAAEKASARAERLVARALEELKDQLD